MFLYRLIGGMISLILLLITASIASVSAADLAGIVSFVLIVDIIIVGYIRKKLLEEYAEMLAKETMAVRQKEKDSSSSEN